MDVKSMPCSGIGASFDFLIGDICLCNYVMENDNALLLFVVIRLFTAPDSVKFAVPKSRDFQGG